ncbi:MAG: short-chain dehydrogenase [Saprospiraceae bacterium]|nr:short-chain dehydrogenase [Candidatus Defluviibacterium haderslevense]
MKYTTVNSLILEMPMYSKQEILNTVDNELLFNLKTYTGTIDFNCKECNSASTWKGTNAIIKLFGTFIQNYEHFTKIIQGHQEQQKIQLANQFYYITFECTRDKNHKSIFVYWVDSFIQKIGQYPSLASMNETNIKKYNKVLSIEKFKEFKRAIGLSAHGIGIGSFVYLRRIFEDLIESAHNESKIQTDWNEENYKMATMDKKIELLKANLPKFLVDNKIIYGILSKGIHELGEDDCVEHFAIMKNGIELMLDEKLSELDKINKTKEAEIAISKVKNKIR